MIELSTLLLMILKNQCHTDTDIRSKSLILTSTENVYIYSSTEFCYTVNKTIFASLILVT